MDDDTLDRTVQFIGRDGQARLQRLHIAVVGVGGLGTHVVQQLAFLRTGALTLIDSEELKRSSRNRYVGSRHDDPIPGSRKVDLGLRLVHSIEPNTQVEVISDSFVCRKALAAIARADYVFGCLDDDGARLVLNEICSAHARPYLDLATEIPMEDSRRFGGRVCISWNGQGCLSCLGVIDQNEATRVLAGPDGLRDRERLYGVRASNLPDGGPAVVTINGVVASLATTEFLVWATGIREPRRLLSYRGDQGKVTVSTDPARPDCYYCKSIFGTPERANLERYLTSGVGSWLR